MTSFISRLRKQTNHTSMRWVESTLIAGVRFLIHEPTLANRIELSKQLYELTMRHDFLANGTDLEQMELALAELLVQKLLVEWGLKRIVGLSIDGSTANTATLLQSGPETLVVEIANAIRLRCELSEEERKN